MNNLPVDIVLVRHGESEGNVHSRWKKVADPPAALDRMAGRHTSHFRLTDLGRLQAQRAGKIVQQRVSSQFDLMYVSEYTRAVETAALLGLPESRFSIEWLLRERDSGKDPPPAPHESMPPYQRKASNLARWYAREVSGRDRLVAGESFSDLCLRISLFLEKLREQAAGLRVLVVCHGHVIRAFRVLLEALPACQYDQLLGWWCPNAHIRWYSRRDEIGRIHSRPHVVTVLNMLDPEDMHREDAEAAVEREQLSQRTYNAAELLELVEQVPQFLNNSDLNGRQMVFVDGKYRELTGSIEQLSDYLQKLSAAGKHADAALAQQMIDRKLEEQVLDKCKALWDSQECQEEDDLFP